MKFNWQAFRTLYSKIFGTQGKKFRSETNESSLDFGVVSIIALFYGIGQLSFGSSEIIIYIQCTYTHLFEPCCLNDL